MRCISLSEVSAKLPTLNSDLTVHDNSNDSVVYWTGNKQRTGIYFRNDFITAIDRGDIPPEKVWTRPEAVPRFVKYDYALKHSNKVETIQQLFWEGSYEYGQFDEMMGPKANPLLINFVSHDVVLERVYITIPNQPVKKGIVARLYQEHIMKPSRLERMGWKDTFSRLIKANIPGVTKESVEKLFEINL